MQIRNLSDVSLNTISATFAQAFEDYLVKVDASPETLGARLYRGRVDYALSFGAFDNEQLVGFLLHGIDNQLKQAHNLGSGVIPAYRGQRLLEQMYEKALPALQWAGIKMLTLEVITENEKAVKAYQNVGLQPKQMLRCFSGKPFVTEELGEHSYLLQKRLDYDWDLIKEMASYSYSWDNMPEAIALSGGYETWLVYDPQNGLNAFAVVHPTTGYLSQIGFHTQAPAALKMFLFKQLAHAFEHIRINNIPNDEATIIELLEKVGLKNHINQFQMKMFLTAGLTDALSMRVATWR